MRRFRACRVTRTLLLALALTGVTVALAAPANAKDPGSANVCNVSYRGVGALGVIHLRRADERYRLGNYDELLSLGHCSRLDYGWTNTAGIYVGPGYYVENHDIYDRLINRVYGETIWYYGNALATYRVYIFRIP